jgi:hypothetical protein
VRINNDPDRINLVFLNHDRNFSTFLTIKYLVEHQRVADIYTLSRSIYESTITMGLLAKDLIVDSINRYQDFQYLEIYKTYEHLKKLGLERLSGVSDSEVQLIHKKRTDYLKKWRSDLSWTGNSLETNVRLIDKFYPPTCNETHFYEYLYCQVYRKGSQSSHSSFAGLLKGVVVEKITIPGAAANRFAVNEPQLIFSCFHSLLVFLSSIRFLGVVLGKVECESYFQRQASYIISEDSRDKA